MNDEDRRLLRAYAALSECCARASVATDEVELVRAVCGTLVDVGRYRMAWIGYPDGTRVRVAAAAGADDGYLDSVQIDWGEGSPLAIGPTGTALRTGEVVVNRDTATNPALAPWREEALKHNFASSIGLPLVFDHETLGALTVYAPVADAFDQVERDLLVGCSRSLGQAIGAMRVRTALDARDRQLRRLAKLDTVGQMAGGCAHDLNNLLLVVSLAAGELSELVPKESAEGERVRDIVDATTSASRLVRQFLRFGQRGGGAQPGVLLSELVEAKRGLLKRAVGRGVEIEVATDPNLARVEVDPDQVEEVLLNLSLNARDAMDGRGVLRLGLRNVAHAPAGVLPPRPAASGFVELSVGDTGPGIPAEHQAHLFEPFFTTKSTGTGLGLAVVLDIIRHHGGQIVVESGSTGTTFRTYWPHSRGGCVVVA